MAGLKEKNPKDQYTSSLFIEKRNPRKEILPENIFRMSHRSGIPVTPELDKAISETRAGKYRLLQIIIKDEQLIANERIKPKNDFESDLDSLLAPLAENHECFYCFYRLDTKNSLGYEFILYSFINDSAPVRSKMIYASTLSTVKTAFGSGHLKRELSVSSPAELTSDGYKGQVELDNVAAPLTESEILKNEIKSLEVTSSVNTRTETVPGLSSAADALRDYSNNKVDYVKFEIDTTQEIIRSLNSERFKGNTEKLQEKVSTSTPNYHLFKFKYNHQSKEQTKNIFIYSIPSEVQIPIKEKMLYASCKSAFVGGMSNFGIEDMLSIEIDSPSEVDHQSLYRQIHPETIPKAQPFAKPPGPARRPRTKPRA